jgi:hypothetical protein
VRKAAFLFSEQRHQLEVRDGPAHPKSSIFTRLGKRDECAPGNDDAIASCRQGGVRIGRASASIARRS